MKLAYWTTRPIPAYAYIVMQELIAQLYAHVQAMLN